MTAVVLQGRLDSRRLPRKILLPLGGKPLIFRVMEALRRIPADLYVLACAGDCAGELEEPAAAAGFELFAGPKDDVLARYCLVVRRYGIDRVIRATGDNPLVFPDAAAAIDAEARSLDAAYGGYSGLPTGAGVESVDAAALLRAGREAVAEDEREHVCPYLYRHPEWFPLHRPLAPKVWQGPSLRITVDTPEDYRRAALIWEALSGSPDSGDLFRGEAIIAAYRAAYRTACRGVFPDILPGLRESR
ncbi:MAG: NTP transferase domain-containing protein [Treponema sp.]|nr:NTP transferase domain-containing protein [Treponema sp.]